MAQSDLEAQAQDFASLHVPHKPLILTNVWDSASAKAAAGHPSCRALGTASYAIAGVIGLADDDLTLEENVAAVERIAKVAKEHGKPLTVDMQSGYGDRLEEGVRKIIAAGAVGLNLEDRDGSTGKMYSADEAAARVGRVVAVAREAGVPHFVVNARTDVLYADAGSVQDAIDRGRAYLDAGATTVFFWGGPKRGVSREEVVQATEAFNGRINVVFFLDKQPTVAEFAKIGVARISVGPQLWWAAMKAFEDGMKGIFDSAPEAH